jgi:dTDP-glucose pyrophosphorylase
MIKKAVILAAGKGTRLMPLTLAIPKEMIRIGIKPVIEHAIEDLKTGGIKDILIIVGRKKEAIMDYLGSGKRLEVNIYYRIQDKPKGSAHALYYGKDFIDSEDFVVMYGDNYLKPYDTMKHVVKFHKNRKADATLVLSPVKDPRRFGIVKIDERGKVLGIIEKPSLKEAKSYRVNDVYLNIAGLLILKNIIFNYIEKTKPGRNNEIWLTDSVELMRRDGYEIAGFVFSGTRYDIGTFKSLKEADKMEQMGK